METVVRESPLGKVEESLRKAAADLDHHGSFRMRVLMKMLLLELEKERTAQATGKRPSASGEPAT